MAKKWYHDPKLAQMFSAAGRPQPGYDDNSARRWLATWLANRRSQLTENSGGVSQASDQFREQTGRLFSVPAYKGLTGLTENYGKDQIQPVMGTPMQDIRRGVLSEAIANMANPYTRGVYTRANRDARVVVAGGYGKDQQSTLVHELAHSMEASPQERKIQDIMKGARISAPSGYSDSENDYLETPTEIHSRLMQIRHDLELDPNRVYNESDLQSIRDKSGYGDKYNFLKRYDDKTILRLLNEVASVSVDDGKRNA